jgi:hypothetical protein
MLDENIYIMTQIEIKERREILLAWLLGFHQQRVFMDAESIMEQLDCYTSTKMLQRDLTWLEDNFLIARKFRRNGIKTQRRIIVLPVGKNLLGYHDYDKLEKAILENKDKFSITFQVLIPQDERKDPDKPWKKYWGHPDKFIKAKEKHGWRIRIISIKLKQKL